MGNKIAKTTQVSASEYYLNDLPSSYNLVYKEALGKGRFFKSIQCKHDEGLILVKVYFKRGDLIDLKDYESRLLEIREIFREIKNSHVWAFQYWIETDKAAYLLRQYFFSNLHDRLSTRPFLSLIEKKWLAFQLLCAVKQCHENGVCHGDIKCENVLVTSWNWLYLADFASFKPTYIPDDDPSDFSFFFDTGGRRRCYLAPERFYEHGGEMQIASDAPLNPSMDIFSLGCVIAELFLEGQPLFELSQLLAYRRGQYDPSQLLEKIPDCGIRRMILHMIQLDPHARLSCESYLQGFASDVFPNYFSPFLHNFFSCLIPLDLDTRVAMTQDAFCEIQKQMRISQQNDGISTDASTPSNESVGQNVEDIKQNSCIETNSIRQTRQGSRVMKDEPVRLVSDICSLLEGVERNGQYIMKNSDAFDNQSAKYLSKTSLKDPTISVIRELEEQHPPFLRKIMKTDLHLFTSVYSDQSDSFELNPDFMEPRHAIKYEGMVLIASLLCSCIRSVKQAQLRRGAVLLLKSSSLYIDDDDRLQHVIPYIVAMLSDPIAIVRCAALEALCDILPLVRDFSPSDSKIFPEYILPMLSSLPDDPEESVRICYARNIFKIALTAYRFLLRSQKLNEAVVIEKVYPNQSPSAPRNSIKKPNTENREFQLAQLRQSIADVVQELVMGSKKTPNVRRALLQDIGNLCFFFGQKQTNDFLLPILPAFLNDRDDQLRADFYGHILFVCFSIGPRSVEEYLLPYIEQALTDPMEAVIVNALECLSILCKNGFLRKRIQLEMIERVFPLLCYPSHWVRRFAIIFIAATSERLGPVDSFVYLSPVVRSFLRREPTSIASEESLLSCLRPPVLRQVFYQVLEDARSSDMLERQRKIWYNSSTYSKQSEVAELSKKEGDLIPFRNWSSKQSANSSIQLQGTIDSEDKEKLRVGSFIRSVASSTIDTKDVYSEKLQFSGFISPQTSGESSFICDGSSEGIPVYSYMGNRATGTTLLTSNSTFQLNYGGISSSYMPYKDPVNRSLNLSSSVPPKLGDTSNQVYELLQQHSEYKEIDQRAHIVNKFQELSIPGPSKVSTLSTMEESFPLPEIPGLSSFSRTSSMPDTGWKPRGVLAAHLQEHTAAVNDIAISNDQSFFVSASDDSTVKIWDTRKLEKDISFRSRLTYPLNDCRALCTTMIYGCAQVFVGACDGTIHVFSVDYVSRGLGNVVERYSGIADIRKRKIGEGAILCMLNYFRDGYSSQSIIFSAKDCGVHLWDTRTNSSSWILKAIPEEGYISSLVTGSCGNWLVSGSSRGVLTLWDLRFLIPVNTWQFSRICPVEKICPLIPPTHAPISITTRPLVYVAAGCNEVSLWNAENGSCHQVFKLASGPGEAEICDTPWALARLPNKPSTKQDLKWNFNAKYRVDELNEPPPRLPGIRSLLPLPGGDLLTGGTDLKIRRWDHCSPDRSYCVCGPTTKDLGNDEFYDTRSSFGVQVVQETSKRHMASKPTPKAVLAAAATDSAGCHHDSILCLASVKLNQRLLISSSRDGAIKVWK